MNNSLSRGTTILTCWGLVFVIALSVLGATCSLASGVGVELVSSVGGSAVGVAVQGKYAYVGEGRSLLVVDIFDPSNPSLVGRVPLPGLVRDVELLNQYAYVADREGGLQVVDVSDPTKPTVRGSYSTVKYSWTVGVALLGGRAYVANENDGLQIFDLSDPGTPRLLSSTGFGGSAEDVVVKATANGVFAYLCTGNNLCIVDVSQPLLPVLKSRTPIGANTFSIAMSGNYVFSASQSGGLYGIDVSDPSAPKPAVKAEGFPYPNLVAAANGVIYAAGWAPVDFQQSFFAFTFDGTAFSLLGQTTGTSSTGNHMALAGGRAYIASGTTGLHIVDVSNPSHPSKINSFTDSGAYGYYDSVAVSGSSVIGDANGASLGDLRIFDIFQPDKPRLTGQISAVSGNRQVLAKSGKAYFIGNGVDGESSSTRIADIGTPGSPQLLATVLSSILHCLRVAVVGNTLYAVGYNDASIGRFIAVDISRPESPVVRATKDFNEYGPNAIPISLDVLGNRAVVTLDSATNPVRMIVLDLSNASVPIVLGSVSEPGNPRDVRLSSDGKWAYVIDGNQNSRIFIIDLSNPSNPVVAGSLPLDVSTGVALERQGNQLYAGTYRGLYVYDLTDAAHPILTRSYTIAGIAGVSVSHDAGGQDDLIYLAVGEAGIVILKLSDLQAPEVIITNPTFFPDYASPGATLNLGGSAEDNQGVARIAWLNDRGGGAEVTGPLDNWVISGIMLQPGTNILTVTAYDQAGNEGSDIVTVVYQSPLQDQTIEFPQMVGRTVKDSPFRLAATASSGLPVEFTILSGPAVLNGNTVTLTGFGLVVVRAIQGGNAAYNPASVVDRSLIVSSGSNVITDIRRLTNGDFTFRFYGEPNQSEVIESSSDLKLWTPIWTNSVNALGYLEFVGPADRSHDFLRIKVH